MEKQELLRTLCVCVCVCVSVALLIQHAMRMSHNVVWPAALYYIFPHYRIKGTIFGKKNVIEQKCVF